MTARVARGLLRRGAISALLMSVCRGEDEALRARLDPDGIVAAARHHRVAPLVHVALRDSFPRVASPLRMDRDRAVAVHLGASAVLDELDHILGEMPWVVFKGPVLSEHAHPVPGLRTYQDIDVLVDPRDLRDATTRLAGAGWALLDFDDILRLPDVPGEMHWMSPTGLQVDLHWSMINMASRRQRFQVPTADLLGRRRRQAVGVTTTWTLDPVDALVHVCLHAALTGADRMLLLLDADQLARRIVNWSEAAARARAWGAQAAVAVVLHRSRRFLGTPVPDDLDRLLGISAVFRAVTAGVDGVVPVPSLRREASIPRLVSRAVRPSTGATVAAIGRSVVVGVRDRLIPRPSLAIREPATDEALDGFVRRVEGEASLADRTRA